MNNTWQVDGIAYWVETTSDLEPSSWESDANKIEWVSPATDNGDGTETVSCRLSTAGARNFIRLEVEELP